MLTVEIPAGAYAYVYFVFNSILITFVNIIQYIYFIKINFLTYILNYFFIIGG